MPDEAPKADGNEERRFSEPLGVFDVERPME
jgi:hypothetical protein